MKSSLDCILKNVIPSTSRSISKPFNVSVHRRSLRYTRRTIGNDSSQPIASTSTFFQASSAASKFQEPKSQHVDENDTLVALLDPYLPLELRSKSWLENLAQFEGIRDVDTLPPLLFETQGSRHLQQDLLSYVGLHQNRWDALLWLIKTMLTSRKPSLALLGDSLVHQASTGSKWTINELMYHPELVTQYLLRNDPHHPINLEQVTGSYKRHWKGELIDTTHDPIGRIWQCVACLILEAADSDTERSSEIMSYAYQIIACMHYHSAIPPTLYNWKYPEDHSAIQRPPTLHLLSARIMTTLSDATWKAYEKTILAEAAQVGAEHVYKGFELPGAGYTPRIRPLSMGVWLDLVLWSCLEGGLILEAAWIVNQILQRESQPAWSVISWETLQNADPSDWVDSGGVNWNSPKSRFNGVAGTMEGYNEDPPLVDMGTRRISSEAIEALIDGLVNNTSSTIEEKAVLGVSTVLRYINKCKRLLERGHEAPRSMSWHSIMLRFIEAGCLSPESSPRFLKSVTELESIYDGALSSRQENQSALGLGILHLILEAYVRLGFTEAAMRTFQTIQDAINPQRAESIPSISQNSMHKGNRKSSAYYIKGTPEGRANRSGCPPIPEAILASYLDLLTDVGRCDIGHWLIYPEAIYEPIIPSTLYASHHLQPALLRYATATRDEGLLSEVTKRLHLPLSPPVVHALLQCQITLEKWDAVEDLLDYMASTFTLGVSDSDIMMVAKVLVCRSIQNDQNQSDRDDFTKAQHILQCMLQGVYDGDPDPSSSRDYSRLRLLNQISRILASTSTYIATIVAPFVKSEGRAHSAETVSVQAFNILLEGIVETQGTYAGKELWDMWCKSPKSIDQDSFIDDKSQASALISDSSGLDDISIPIVTDDTTDELGREKVVAPTLQTVRIILSPILKRINAEQSEKKATVNGVQVVATNQIYDISPSDIQVLDWGVARYKELGMTDREIDQEIPRYLKEG